MKLLCTILALIVLTLSVQPVCMATAGNDTCCTTDVCTEEQGGQDDGADKKCVSGCNPFQLCACCAFCVVIPQAFSFTFLPDAPAPAIQWGAQVAGITEEAVPGFWQPPRAV
ncbi:MAG: hypothetical protein V4649_15390 [Bacteroidota bacterium]